ncbi:hypothetical protein ABIB26_003918 [Arthrobacter sp. UYEF20]
MVLIYAALLVLLAHYARHHPETVVMKEALRMLPDLLALLRRLAADRTLRRGIRVRRVLLLVYLASPIDLVPTLFRSSGTPMTSSSWRWSCARSSGRGQRTIGIPLARDTRRPCPDPAPRRD